MSPVEAVRSDVLCDGGCIVSSSSSLDPAQGNIIILPFSDALYEIAASLRLSQIFISCQMHLNQSVIAVWMRASLRTCASVYARVSMRSYLLACMCLRARLCEHACLCACLCANVCAYLPSCMCACLFACVRVLCASMRVSVYVRACVQS